jgi:hypothetical protein
MCRIEQSLYNRVRLYLYTRYYGKGTYVYGFKENLSKCSYLLQRTDFLSNNDNKTKIRETLWEWELLLYRLVLSHNCR